MCLLQVFKKPLEESFDQRGGPLLVAEEIKTIFGSLPEIMDVHHSILVCWGFLLFFVIRVFVFNCGECNVELKK